MAETTEETEEITTIVPIAAVKPAETYLVEDAAASDGEATEDSIPDVVDLKTDEDSSVEPEAPTIQPVEIYSVETEATLVEVEAPEDETEAPAVETEGPVIGTEVSVSEAEAPAIKPAETYIVETEATIANTEAETVASVVGTEGTVAETEAPAVKIVETYLVEEEPVAPVEALKPTETYIVEEEITTDGEPANEPTDEVAYDTDEIELNAGSDRSVGENTEAEGSSVENSPQVEEVKALETVANSVEPAIVKPNHVEGYWIEVSGDRDVLVKYHV